MMTKEKRQAIQERLLQLEDENGRLTPESVLEDARDPESPLHDQFEWDTDKAAHRYWLDQARTIITSVRVVTKTEKSIVSTVYYTRDPSAGPHEQGYRSVPRLRTDADAAREAIVQEFTRVADLLRRARELAIALSVEDQVDVLLTDVVRLQRIVMEQPEMAQ